MKESNQQRAKKILRTYRKQIDDIDDQILKLLGERFGVIRAVAKIKIKQDLPSFFHDRVEEVRNRCVKMGKEYGIDPAFVYSLYSHIIYHSCATEDMIRAKLEKKKK